MKRVMGILLALVMLFALSCPAFAVEVETQGSEKQDRIDEIFEELNELALAVNMKNSAAYAAVYSEEQLNENQLNSINNRKEALDSELESLGVHKIDPDCEEDLEHLGNVMLHAIDASALDDGLCAAAIEDPPKLETLARKYSIYQYDDSIYTDKIYNCSYVVVVDDKGYNGLTVSDVNIDLCEEKSIHLSDLVKYTFNFGFAQYMGTRPYGWAVNWTIGAIFTGLDSYNSSSIVARVSDNIYGMIVGSTTQMTYYYIYDEGYSSWVLCGSRASSISLSRMDLFSGNISGEYIQLSEISPASSSTGESAKWYFLQYAQNNRKSNHHSPGSFTVNGMGGNSTTFTPLYRSSPHLL